MARNAHLAVESQGRTRIVRLTGPEVSIGREASNTVVLSDETVSQHHARLVLAGDAWSLVDDGSTNGSYVNGTRVTERLLAPSDILQLGSVRIVFDLDDWPAGGSSQFDLETMSGNDLALGLADEWTPSRDRGEDGRTDPTAATGHEDAGASHATVPERVTVGPPNSDEAEARRDGTAAVVRGIARNVELRRSQNDYQALVFRLDRYDGLGNRLPGVSVNCEPFRRGHVGEGEEVEARGTWDRGALKARHVRNLSTGAHFDTGLATWQKVAAALFLALFAICFLGIMGFIAVAVLSEIFS